MQIFSTKSLSTSPNSYLDKCTYDISMYEKLKYAITHFSDDTWFLVLECGLPIPSSWIIDRKPNGDTIIHQMYVNLYEEEMLNAQEL